MSNTYTFSVPDMSCGHCKMRISNALKAATNVSNFEVDLDAKIVTVNTEQAVESIIDVIDTAGYDAALAK